MPDHEHAAAGGAKKAYIVSALVFALAVVVAAFLRFYLIGVKPLHHDEGVNSYFLLDLYRRGHYVYNPDNYHGPTLYYLTLVALYLWGLTDLALRFWPALFGLLSVALVWPLRRYLGWVGTPVAAWLMALSPGLVYFSRDFIHESSFGFFTLGMVVAAWKYGETRRFVYLALFAVAAGLLFATKETAVITEVVLALALICAALWMLIRRLAGQGQPVNLLSEVGREAWSARPPIDPLISAVIIFVFVNVVFYSSFFSNWKGIGDAVHSVFSWTERGTSGQEHEHAFHYYLGILVKLELPLLVGAAVGVAMALWRAARFGLFLTAWSIGIVLAYSLIPYKTPWLMVSMLVPLALLSGYAAQEVWGLLRAASLRLAFGLALFVAAVLSAQMAYRVNFEKHDDNTNSTGYLTSLKDQFSALGLKAYNDEQYGGYVYAQTDRDLLNLVREIREAAGRMPTGKETDIHIASPDYWPLPWYLHDYGHVAYAGSLPTAITQPILVAGAGQREEVERQVGSAYRASSFKLRPGVELVLYVREGQGAGGAQ